MNHEERMRRANAYGPLRGRLLDFVEDCERKAETPGMYLGAGFVAEQLRSILDCKGSNNSGGNSEEPRALSDGHAFDGGFSDTPGFRAVCGCEPSLHTTGIKPTKAHKEASP